MNLRAIKNRLKPSPARLENDLNDELEFHLEMKQREFEREGMSPEEARLAARRSLGNLTLAREDSRSAWRMNWFVDLWQDLRYGARTLASQRGFAFAAILALTVGIGLNGILFSVYNALALAPYAVREPASLAQVVAERGRTGRFNGVPWPEYRHLRNTSQSVSAMAAWDTAGLRIAFGDSSWKAAGIWASENFFDVLGTGFVSGRGFSPEAGNLLHPAPEVVLQHETWRDRFGGDPSIVGRWLTVNGRQLQVVGVTAPGFAGPTPLVPDLWVPAPWRDIFHPDSKMINDVNSCCAQVMARLRPGVSRESAALEMAALSTHFNKPSGIDNRRFMLTRPSLMASPGMKRNTTQVFILLFAASASILLLASANVANLLLARAASRRREIAIRLSIGAGPGRILRQLLAEGFLLSSMAAVLTLILAQSAPGAIIKWITPGTDRIGIRFDTDWRVIGFVVAATFMATMIFAVAPGLSAIREGVGNGLRESGGRVTSSNRLRFGLLTAQVALCATLLSGAWLLVRALEQSRMVDPGFEYRGLIVLSPNLESSGVTNEQASAPINLLRERVRTVPGVESVAFTSVLPLGRSFDGTSVPRPNSQEQVQTGFTAVSSGFFETLRIPLLAGRLFVQSDESRTDVAIVNQALADRLWPGESPVGKMIKFSKGLEVVGLVRSVHTRGIDREADPQLYVPSKGGRTDRIILRHSGDGTALLEGLTGFARQVDRRFLAGAEPYSNLVNMARREAAVAASIGGALSGIALALALVGIYAVAGYHVAERTREFGVRIALGAKRGQILRLVATQNLKPVLLGAALGVAGAIVLGQSLSMMLYGVKPGDIRALVWTALTLAASSALAIWGPVRRAASVDPAAALRHE